MADDCSGMTKTYRLTYESVEVMHALFDRTVAKQGWRISSRVLREYIEFFGPKTEQLDLLAQGDKAIFTSFTEKIATATGKLLQPLNTTLTSLTDRTETLKQPLETAISLHTEDFEDFHMQQDMHIVISVKDFKAIVTHAETLRTPISAYFSLPTRPMQFSYSNLGIHAEFTLMTTGDIRAASSTPNPKFVSTRSSSRQPSMTPAQMPSRMSSEMPPPPRPTLNKLSSQSQRVALKPQQRQPSMTESDPDPESLFMPGDDEDRRWDPPNYDNDDGEEMLGWDANNEHPSQQTFRDSGSAAKLQKSRDGSVSTQEGLDPTQRLSQVRMYAQWASCSSADIRSCMECSTEPAGMFSTSLIISLSVTSSHDEAGGTSSEDRLDRLRDSNLGPASFDIAVRISRLAAVPMLTPAPC